MPTVLRFDGLRAAIYLNDHRPAHVHVIGPDAEAVFNLGCPLGPIELRENYGFSGRDLKWISRTLSENLPQLCAAWGAIHGFE